MIADDMDRVALERALALVLDGEDRIRAEQVADMQRTCGWRYAEFSAHVLQFRALQLRPWETPPSAESVDPDDDSPQGRLLARMLAAGLSKYDPDPLAALEALKNKAPA